MVNSVDTFSKCHFIKITALGKKCVLYWSGAWILKHLEEPTVSIWFCKLEQWKKVFELLDLKMIKMHWLFHQTILYTYSDIIIWNDSSSLNEFWFHLILRFNDGNETTCSSSRARNFCGYVFEMMSTGPVSYEVSLLTVICFSEERYRIWRAFLSGGCVDVVSRNNCVYPYSCFQWSPFPVLIFGKISMFSSYWLSSFWFLQLKLKAT